VPCDHRCWGICDCREARHCRGTAREEAWLTVHPASRFGTDDPRRERGTGRAASGFGTDDPHHEGGAGRADSGAVGTEDLGVRRRYNG
jgi:hypothetical protein